MIDYYYQKKNFVIESFDKSKTFSSFLPGISGLKGIPMWVFYVNRGQAIASFGIQDKGSSILEFSPASIAYQNVSKNGFRTFIKINNHVYEPFGIDEDLSVKRTMHINEATVSIVETNAVAGYEIKVDYCSMPNENFAALIRKVSIKNISDAELDLEILDGITSLFPYGVHNESYKSVGNLLRSWMEVYNIDSVPFYKLRSATGDEAEVKEITKGNFYLSFSEDDQLIKPIVDSEVIFGYDTSLQKPVEFINHDIDHLITRKQITANKLPCGFSGLKRTLKVGDEINLHTLIGHVPNISFIEGRLDTIVKRQYILDKFEEAFNILRSLTDDVYTKTNNILFDEYCRQCYLDNLIRGGYPLLLDNDRTGFVYHVYSRKHGDLERDYNWFSLDPEFYSQGNGNYRDVNQNRRNDVVFNSYVGDYNIKTFMSLIQIDGYNPLSVRGSTFSIKENIDIDQIISQLVSSHHDEFKKLLSMRFTPGKIINFITNHQVGTKCSDQEILKIVLSQSVQHIEASFGEGYWVDHFIYNMDLIESYLKIFPDLKEQLFFEDSSYRYYDSAVSVLPRSEKYVINDKNQVRQYGALRHFDEEKIAKLKMDKNETNWLKTHQGAVYETNLYVKLLSLAIIKFATLDPYGIGIGMEANKPGWNDAMNGLPGLFGSSVGETFELIRIVNCLIECSKYDRTIELPLELSQLLVATETLLTKLNEGVLSQFEYWDELSTEREKFRENTRFGIQGNEERIHLNVIGDKLGLLSDKLALAILEAKKLGSGIYPTFLSYEAVDYEIIRDSSGQEVKSHYGFSKVKVKKFKVVPLPLFIEAPAKAYKITKDKELNKEIYHLLKQTDAYDKKLKMYKTSESLENESLEIGRARAFTPGWLERESIFLHMTYKYLLGILEAELYDEFFEELKTNLIPFLDPKIYGRSTLENTSFLASSVNPNPNVHGQGFFARLSGSTSEFLNMWIYMMFGKEPFFIEDNKLRARLNPILPAALFNQDGTIQCKFLNKTLITYYNPSKKDTYHLKVNKMVLKTASETKEVNQSFLDEEDAKKLRDGQFEEVDVYLGN